MNKMTVNEIIDKIKFAIELAGDGGVSPFSEEEYNEMMGFLNANRMEDHGYHQWHRGEKPRWKVGDILAYYEFYSDYEGEQILGEVIRVEISEYNDDWVYVFKDEYSGEEDYYSEENLVDEQTYTITKEYYNKHK